MLVMSKAENAPTSNFPKLPGAKGQASPPPSCAWMLSVSHKMLALLLLFLENKCFLPRFPLPVNICVQDSESLDALLWICPGLRSQLCDFLPVFLVSLDPAELKIQTSTGLENTQLIPRHASVFICGPRDTRTWAPVNAVYSPCSHFPNPRKQEGNTAGPSVSLLQTARPRPPCPCSLFISGTGRNPHL